MAFSSATFLFYFSFLLGSNEFANESTALSYNLLWYLSFLFYMLYNLVNIYAGRTLKKCPRHFIHQTVMCNHIVL